MTEINQATPIPLNLAKMAHKHDSDRPQLKINWLVQGRRNSSVLAMELRLSCTNPLRWW